MARGEVPSGRAPRFINRMNSPAEHVPSPLRSSTFQSDRSAASLKSFCEHSSTSQRSTEAIRDHQRQSEVIRASSSPASIRAPLAQPPCTRQSRYAPNGCDRSCGRVGSTRRRPGRRMPRIGTGCIFERGRRPVPMSDHQRASAIRSDHQRSSAIISDHQRSSAIISVHLGDHQRPVSTEMDQMKPR